ncbi:hypothetical protein QR680_016774 [Steinernema hermaphroditum]|uniref:Uncharacterized protein n=1 Tax=Steinernema hermaphroditum TaxID=289476 RepID=A0AA39HC95_9BILA|nr:hypothetical protein QR680_016774 [Steinernema hermaphroditum]
MQHLYGPPGWVTDDLLTKCIMKNADLLVSANSDGHNRTLRNLKRPPSERAAVALESITGRPFISARTRPPDEEDELWEARLNPVGPRDEGIATHPQEKPQVPALNCTGIVGAHIDAKLFEQDLPEDLEFINRELLEEELMDLDEVDQKEIRELIDETRKREAAAVLFERRERYIVDPRRRVINPYLLDEKGERLQVEPASSVSSVMTSECDTMQLSSGGSSIHYRTEILNRLRRMDEMRGEESQEFEGAAADDESSFGDGCIEISDDDSFIFEPAEDECS